MSNEKLSIEGYAHLAAHLAHFQKADPAEVVERLGIPREVADEAQTRWSLALREDLETPDMPLAQRMAEVFVPVRARLAETRPELASIGPRATPDRRAVADVVPAGMRRMTSVDTTQVSPSSNVAPALPFAAGVAVTPQRALPSEKAQIPEGMRRFVSVTGTVASPSQPSPQPATPFDDPAHPDRRNRGR